MKEEKYYLIPILDRDILIDGTPTKEILKKNYPELYKMEEERICILYSSNPCETMPQKDKVRYREHIKNIKNKINELMVPPYIIAIGNGFEVKELLTGKPITTNYYSALAVREVSKEKALEHYYQDNYRERIVNFIKDEDLSINEPDLYDLEVCTFVEGELNGEKVSGIFSGIIKLKREKK